MDEPEHNSLAQVDALVEAYLARQAEQVDGAAGLARVQAAMDQTSKVNASRWRRGFRLALAASIAAAVALAFFGGWYLSPAQAGPRELVEEVKRVHKFGARKGGRGTKEEGRKLETPSATVSFIDVTGRTHTPLSQPDKKATVFFFVLPDCPISNAYAPEIQRICAAYEPKRIALFLVHADPDVTVPQATKHATTWGFSCPVLLDPAHMLVKKTGVTMAPEVAVLAPDGKVLYRGRIDDWYVDYGKRRGEPNERNLRDALDTVLQGKAVSTPTTKAIGCYLPEPKP